MVATKRKLPSSSYKKDNWKDQTNIREHQTGRGKESRLDEARSKAERESHSTGEHHITSK